MQIRQPKNKMKNNPNTNYAMYNADREARRKSQPQLPSVLRSDEDDRRGEREVYRMEASRDDNSNPPDGYDPE